MPPFFLRLGLRAERGSSSGSSSSLRFFERGSSSSRAEGSSADGSPSGWRVANLGEAAAVVTAWASSSGGASNVLPHLAHLTFLPAGTAAADLSTARQCGHVSENAMTPFPARNQAIVGCKNESAAGCLY